MNFYKHHIGDYDADTAHLTWTEDAAYRRLLCLYYRREQPIPADVAQACRLVRAVSKSEREAVDTVLREFFTASPDGWINKRCDEELSCAEELGGEREAKQQNERERQRRHRDERKKLFEKLREMDVVPAWDTKTETLRAMVREPPVTPPVTPIERDESQPVTRTATANQTPDTTSQTPDTREEREPRAPTPAGEACLAMRQAGLTAVNPSDPRLTALLAAGMTADELAAAAGDAVTSGKGFAYAMATAEGRRRDAAKVKALPGAPNGADLQTLFRRGAA